MKGINFFSEEILFKVKNSNKLSRWISEIIKIEKKSIKQINFIFCSDNYLHKMNRNHLNSDFLTDIITFDNSDKESEIEGDIYISIDRVMENSKLYNNKFDAELYRIMIHGVLHLLGYNDKTNSEKLVMKKKEEACLSLLKI